MFKFKAFQDWIYTQYIEFEYPKDWIIKDFSDLFKSCECRSLWIHGPWNKRNTCSTLLSVMIYPINIDNPCYQYPGEALTHQIHMIHSIENDLIAIKNLYPKLVGRNELLEDHEIEVDNDKAREIVVARAISELRPQVGWQESFNYKEGERSYNRYVAFEKNSYGYELSYQTPEDEDKKYIEVYKRFLSTFRVFNRA